MLIEQASFLLEHQKENLTHLTAFYAELLTAARMHATNTALEINDEQALAVIVTALQNMADQAEKNAHHALTWLTEHIEELKTIAAIADETERTEKFDLLVDHTMQINPDTDEFKKIVTTTIQADQATRAKLFTYTMHALNTGKFEQVATELTGSAAQE